MRVLVFAAALYLIAPGHPDVMLAGIPLGQTGAFLLIILLVLWAWTRDVDAPVKPWLARAMGIAVAAKFAIALVVPHSGWLATYYAKDVMRYSVDYLSTSSTRIDPQLSFVDTEFPVHFFNEWGFNFGSRRESTEPFQVLWRGVVQSADPLNVHHEARGDLSIAIDGQRTDANPIAVAAGDHVIEVRYRKDKDVEGMVQVAPLDRNGAVRPWAIGEVMPGEFSAARRTASRLLVPIAWLIHLLAALIVIAALVPAVRSKVRHLRQLPWLDAAHRSIRAAVILGLCLQGLWKSRHLVGHVFTLTGGDDWLGFEMQARDGLLKGWMMAQDKIPGTGMPFFIYPGYSYFVAGVHWLIGESLAGIILANFVVLAIATVLVHAVAMRFTTKLGALFAVLWLLALEQLDFVRYYTVTLLSENLYVALLAVTVWATMRLCKGGSTAWAVAAGIGGGLAAITRPTMMLFLPVAMILAALARLLSRRYTEALVVPVVLMLCWLAAVAPITYRNYVMSGKAVLITAGQGPTFIDYNLPTEDPAAALKYRLAFDGSMTSVVKVLLWIFWEHPVETLRNLGIKTGFSLGMVHWMGSSGVPHPELVLTSLLYFASLLFVRSARTLPALAVHGFILTHLATLMLSMPSNYGYRLVLPMYVLMTVFVGALGAQIVEPRLTRWMEHRAA